MLAGSKEGDAMARRLSTAAVLLMAAGLLGVLADACAGTPPNGVAEVPRLIEKLGSARYADREVASKRLDAIGEPAWYLLTKAAVNGSDLEVRRRARTLARKIGQRCFREIRHFGGQGGYWLNRVAFSRDGRRAIATGGAVIVYDLANGRELYRVLERSFARPALAVSLDGRYFLTGHQNDSIVRLGEVAAGKPVQTFRGHTAGVFAVALSPDGRRALSGSQDGTMRLWDVKTGEAQRVFQRPGRLVGAVAFSPDGKYLLSAHIGTGSDNLVRLWEADSGRELRCLGQSREVTALAFLPDGNSFLCANLDGSLRQVDVKSFKELRRMVHRGGAHDIAVCPDGRRFLSAGWGDQKVRLWDLRDGSQLHVYEGHQGPVLGVAVSPDGRQALSCDTQYTVRHWRLPPPEDYKAR
jgi:WD40 repeat protein